MAVQEVDDAPVSTGWPGNILELMQADSCTEVDQKDQENLAVDHEHHTALVVGHSWHLRSRQVGLDQEEEPSHLDHRQLKQGQTPFERRLDRIDMSDRVARNFDIFRRGSYRSRSSGSERLSVHCTSWSVRCAHTFLLWQAMHATAALVLGAGAGEPGW